MNKLFLVSLISLLPRIIFAQANCSNPVVDTLCVSTVFLNQTNAGMLDDATSNYNIAGEDLVYRIYAPTGAQRIYVSVQNLTGYAKFTLTTGSCTATYGYTRTSNGGNLTFSSYVSSSNYYYLWVDAPTTITYDISIGGDSTAQYVYVPNTQGLWRFCYCSTNAFKPAKPFYEILYNGVYQTDPLTYSPLNVAGNLCIRFYLENTTGVGGLKNVSIHFNYLGYINVNPTATTIPGFYNAGNWNLTSTTGGTFTYEFTDSAGLGRGDFDGSPNFCLGYEFCFNVTPVSNAPQLTNVELDLLSDSYGIGYSYYNYSGCCPNGYANCHGSGPGTIGGVMGFGFSFDDPGGLPVTLLEFDAKQDKEKVKLTWSTASEINNDYFTIEKSKDGISWNMISRIEGAGNSTSFNEYMSYDEHPDKGSTFYRLSQTDIDGHREFFKVVECKFSLNDFRVYPSPAKDNISIDYPFKDEKIEILNSFGQIIRKIEIFKSQRITINVNDLIPGIYFINLWDGFSVVNSTKFVVEQ